MNRPHSGLGLGPSHGQMRWDSLLGPGAVALRSVLGSYTEAEGYYHHSEHTGVCSGQQYEPFVQKTKMESK